MREFPRQPKPLDRDDEVLLAVIGRRLERWDNLKNESIPIQIRVDTLLSEIDREVQSLKKLNIEASEPELQMLAEDMSIAKRLVTTDEETIRDICEERVAEYREMRHALIRVLKEE